MARMCARRGAGNGPMAGGKKKARLCSSKNGRRINIAIWNHFKEKGEGPR